MRAGVSVALTCCALAFTFGSASVQPARQGHSSVAPAWPIGFVSGAARQRLTADWTENPYQTERGYCVDSMHLDTTWARSGYRAVYVTAITRAKAKDSTQETIDFGCRVGQPMIHTHAAYCDITQWGVDLYSCSMDRPEALQCQPSLPDVASLLISKAPFGVIQCGRRQFRFYFATDYLWMLKGVLDDLQSHSHSNITHDGAAVSRSRQATRTASVSQPGHRGDHPGQSRSSHVSTWLDRGRRRVHSVRRHRRGGGR